MTTQTNTSIPPASLHTPDELLATATELMNSGNPKMYRGAILEAQAALESFVQKLIFPVFKMRFGSEIAEFLEQKTMMDFDGRLSILVPIATRIPVSTNDDLWKTHKKIRKLRNSIVHGTKVVSLTNAQEVIKHTADWMAHLSSTLELEKALLELKSWVEAQAGLIITSRQETEKIVADFFSNSKAASATLNKTFKVNGRTYEADAILDFGKEKVLIETKLITYKNHLKSALQNSLTHTDELLKISKVTRACVVVFLADENKSAPIEVEKHLNGDIFSIIINVKYKPSGS